MNLKILCLCKKSGKILDRNCQNCKLEKNILAQPKHQPSLKSELIGPKEWHTSQNGTLRHVFVPGSYEIEEDFRT